MSEPKTPFDVQPSVSNHFAWLRTQLAMQRTLMAAIRTAVSLIGFGFTVAQFFEKFMGEEHGGRLSAEAPRNFGLLLIAAGVASLLVFTWQYHIGRSYLWSGPYRALAGEEEAPMRTSAYLMAGVVTFIGVAAFLAVLFRF